MIDEYGGTSGMMTVEDIVEELFGEIEDEHDNLGLIEEKISDRHYKFSARHEIDYLNETYKITLPESENYGTLGGFVVSHTEEIPKAGETITIGSFVFNVLQRSTTKIELLELHISQD